MYVSVEYGGTAGMVGPTKTEALGLFSHPVPGYRIEGAWVDSTPVAVPENTGVVLSDFEKFAAPIPWAKFETSEVKIPVVTNLATWRDAAQWSAGDGSIVNADPPVWAVREITFAQLAVQLTVDTATEAAQAAYDVQDAALRAVAQMMTAAMYRQLCSTTPDVNGPRSFYDVASDQLAVVDAGGAPLSFDLLMCLRQKVDTNTGSPAQFSLVLARDVYADFAAMMTAVGLSPEPDPVTGQKHWFFDRVRVVESGYLESGNAMVVKADLAVLPEALRQGVAPGAGRGILIGSTHAQGVVVSNSTANATTDQVDTALQLNVGLVHADACAGWMVNIGT